jgi:hypothetical protein
MTHRALISFAVVVAAFLSTSGAAARSATTQLRTDRVTVDDLITGGSGSVRGWFTFTVPQSWKREASRSGSNLARYQFTARDGCQQRTGVWVHPVATRISTARQIDNVFRVWERRSLGRGRRPHGSWGVAETAGHPSTKTQAVYAIAPVHLDGQVYAQVRVLPSLVGDACTPADIALAARHAERIVRQASVHLRVLRAN